MVLCSSYEDKFFFRSQFWESRKRKDFYFSFLSDKFLALAENHFQIQLRIPTFLLTGLRAAMTPVMMCSMLDSRAQPNSWLPNIAGIAANRRISEVGLKEGMVQGQGSLSSVLSSGCWAIPRRRVTWWWALVAAALAGVCSWGIPGWATTEGGRAGDLQCG